MTGAGHDLARTHRADDQTTEEREELVAGLGRARPAHDLEPAWQEHDRGEERHRRCEHRDHRDRERAVAEEGKRNERL